ncbi:MAG: Co2+/Mg2+ efflux protein ApaG [Gammaproteobacteria bacterium]|nr:Co2+/Mg2+ efflux protein ApaG [Gammaproteobacteria bacterium]
MNGFVIKTEPRYIEKESDPENERYVFAYTITIENHGDASAQLLNRRWRVSDGTGRIQEVNGPGVVGKQPHIAPGEAFRYTSAAIIETPVGSMAGHYEFQRVDGSLFEVPIPIFSLSVPNMVH